MNCFIIYFFIPIIKQYIKLINDINNNTSYIIGNFSLFPPHTSNNKIDIIDDKNHNIHLVCWGSFEYVDIILYFS